MTQVQEVQVQVLKLIQLYLALFKFMLILLTKLTILLGPFWCQGKTINNCVSSSGVRGTCDSTSICVSYYNFIIHIYMLFSSLEFISTFKSE